MRTTTLTVFDAEGNQIGEPETIDVPGVDPIDLPSLVAQVANLNESVDLLILDSLGETP